MFQAVCENEAEHLEMAPAAQTEGQGFLSRLLLRGTCVRM